jgi:hypothetical protein
LLVGEFEADAQDEIAQSDVVAVLEDVWLVGNQAFAVDKRPIMAAVVHQMQFALLPEDGGMAA